MSTGPGHVVENLREGPFETVGRLTTARAVTEPPSASRVAVC
jgi:hypothetical protein